MTGVLGRPGRVLGRQEASKKHQAGRLAGWQAGRLASEETGQAWRSLFSENIKKPFVFITFWNLRGNSFLKNTEKPFVFIAFRIQKAPGWQAGRLAG